MFNRIFLRSSQEEQTLTEGFIPAIESSTDKDGKRFRCQVMLPGVDPKDVNIQVLETRLQE
jgi:HSP20 family molecular chaperone IbpA